MAKEDLSPLDVLLVQVSGRVPDEVIRVLRELDRRVARLETKKKKP